MHDGQLFGVGGNAPPVPPAQPPLCIWEQLSDSSDNERLYQFATLAEKYLHCKEDTLYLQTKILSLGILFVNMPARSG